MIKYVLKNNEKEHLEDIVNKFSENTINNNEEYLRNIYLLSHCLPKNIINNVLDFKYQEQEGILILSGLPIPPNLSPTPPSWKVVPQHVQDISEIILLTITSLLGDHISWNTQQDGRLIHNIVPSKGDENLQIGSSTLSELLWHTEEAFHEFRCDYLGLYCLRNPQRVATTYASIKDLSLSESEKRILFENNYLIFPDSSHLNGETPEEMGSEKTSVLYGSFSQPYLRIDPYYMKCAYDDEKHISALENITSQLNRNLKKIILQPGELCIIDNFTSVHGRESFIAKYDGNDRWLKRVNITRDLRKSRTHRIDSSSRIINYKKLQ